MFFGKTTIEKCGILHGMVDAHSHILWGVDDGISTKEESLETLKLLEEAGVSQMWCTPHIMEEVPNTPEGLKARFAELQEVYTGNIKLQLASENMLDSLYTERLAAGHLLLHKGERVLVETSYYNPPIGLKVILQETMKAGYRPLLAHPERYRYMELEDYGVLKDMGVDFQLNLPSVVGAYGHDAQEKAIYILKNGMADELGMDLHSLSSLKYVLGCKIGKKVVKLLEEVKK